MDLLFTFLIASINIRIFSFSARALRLIRTLEIRIQVPRYINILGYRFLDILILVCRFLDIYTLGYRFLDIKILGYRFLDI